MFGKERQRESIKKIETARKERERLSKSIKKCTYPLLKLSLSPSCNITLGRGKGKRSSSAIITNSKSSSFSRSSAPATTLIPRTASFHSGEARSVA
jgi:hypothetical protein